MKVSIPNVDLNAQGGGWSFTRNFIKVMSDNISSYDDSDIYFIPSASMVSREDVQKAKQDGKKVVLRCDNIIKNSRNRNTGMSRMLDFAEWSDLVVYQSKFAYKLLNDYLKPKNSTIILNSVDQDIFNTNGLNGTNNSRYLYSKYSSDPTKNYDIARMSFQEIANPNKSLTLVGRFDGDLEQYNFDFYQGEKVDYVGLVTDPVNMAKVYKSCDTFLYSYFQDACSQTLIEALSCGLEIHDCYGMLNTGGAPDIMEKTNYQSGSLPKDLEYFGLPRMAGEYFEAFSKL